MNCPQGAHLCASISAFFVGEGGAGERKSFASGVVMIMHEQVNGFASQKAEPSPPQIIAFATAHAKPLNMQNGMRRLWDVYFRLAENKTLFSSGGITPHILTSTLF